MQITVSGAVGRGACMEGSTTMKDKSAEGLRGIAALNVTICHFIAALHPMVLHKIWPDQFARNADPGLIFRIFESPGISIFFNGQLAVTIFWILSGYVLTIPYFKGNAERSLKSRLYGRYLRLNIPIFASIVLSYIFYKFHFYQNIQPTQAYGSNLFQGFTPSGVSFITAVKVSLLGGVLFGDARLNPPLWTLKVEFIGSILLLCFYLCKPKQRDIVTTLLVLYVIYKLGVPDFIFIVPIFLGAVLNLVSLDKKWSMVFFIAGFYFGAYQFESVLYNYLPSIGHYSRGIVYSTVGAVFLTASIFNGFGRNFFESKFAQFLGRISFSLYLLHCLILYSFSHAFYMHLPHTKVFLLLNFISYILICFLMASVFEKYIDKFAIKISHKFAEYLLKAPRGYF